MRLKKISISIEFIKNNKIDYRYIEYENWR